MLTAENHVHDYEMGQNKPQAFWCVDDEGNRARWVLKLMGSSVAELAADYAGSYLAHRLELRCPQFDVAGVTREALQTAPDHVQAWAHVGPAFASRELIHSQSGLTDDDIAAKCEPEMLGAMFALDAWLDVLDRKNANIWNALLETDDSRIYVIDYGKGLTPCLQKLLERPTDMSLVQAPKYPGSIRLLASLDAARAACATIEGLGRVELRELANSIPADWMSQDSRGCIVEFLTLRQEHVRAVCEQMREAS